MKERQELNWIKISDEVPEDGQKVLMKCDDEYHVAIYDKQERGFRLGGNALLSHVDCDIFWVAITPP
jgi:hypothetical protein